MADISKIKLENTSYNIKDETARTNISSLDTRVTALENDIVPFFCVLKPTSEGWSILNDSAHEPLNVTSVEIAEGHLIIHHDIGNAKVLSCSITPDEMLSKYGIRCGASLGTNLTIIDLFMNLVVNCYWRYISAQGGLVVQEGFSNLVQSLTWDDTKHCIHIVFDPNVAITAPTNWRSEFNYTLGLIATQLQRKLSTIYTANGVLDVYMYDASGNQITTVADFDRINASYEINKAISPQALVDHPIYNSNLWVTGWLKKLPET